MLTARPGRRFPSAMSSWLRSTPSCPRSALLRITPKAAKGRRVPTLASTVAASLAVTACFARGLPVRRGASSGQAVSSSASCSTGRGRTPCATREPSSFVGWHGSKGSTVSRRWPSPRPRARTGGPCLRRSQALWALGVGHLGMHHCGRESHRVPRGCSRYRTYISVSPAVAVRGRTTASYSH
jgi:hypothetical protein